MRSAAISFAVITVPSVPSPRMRTRGSASLPSSGSGMVETMYGYFFSSSITAVAQERVPPAGVSPVAKLAVIRPYSTRAICCSQGPAWAAWRNPADRILEAYVRAWGVDNGLLYDVFELPPVQTAAEKAVLAEELKKYKFVVSTLPYPGARVIGEGTEGTVATAKEIAALRKKFAAEISALKSKK